MKYKQDRCNQALYRVIRGGCYWAGYCRSANRYWWSPDYRNSDLGLRLARSR
jgi:formylglycine-generating enzyme required for sulfatase activity